MSLNANINSAKNKNSKINQDGFSLIEVMIAAGIMMIIMMAFGMFTSFQNRELRTLKQRVERDDFSRLLALRLSASASGLCSCQLNGKQFDSSLPNPSIAIAAIKDACGSSTNLVAPNEKIFSSQSNLIVKPNGINLVAITKLRDDDFEGKLLVDVADGLGGGLNMAPAEVTIEFLTTGPLNGIKTIGSCKNISGGGPVINGQCAPGQYVVGINQNTVNCAPASALNPTPQGGFSLANPGPGCSGADCVTLDYGPCSGANCVTNGNLCTMAGCTACGPNGSSGNGGCAGPSCPKCNLVGL